MQFRLHVGGDVEMTVGSYMIGVITPYMLRFSPYHLTGNCPDVHAVPVMMKPEGPARGCFASSFNALVLSLVVVGWRSGGDDIRCGISDGITSSSSPLPSHLRL